MRMHRAAAELLRLQHTQPELAELIRDFIESKADSYINEIQADYNILQEVVSQMEDTLYQTKPNKTTLQYTYNKLKGLFTNMVYHLVPMSALSMDAYLLARMFLQTDSQEIIVFAGSKHIEHYTEFFKYYLAAQPVIDIPSETDNRCLVSTKLPQYLPANKYRTYVAKKTHHIK